MWTIIFLTLCAMVLAYVVLKIAKRRELPQDTYVCPVCGEKHCLCHKEERIE